MSEQDILGYVKCSFDLSLTFTRSMSDKGIRFLRDVLADDARSSSRDAADILLCSQQRPFKYFPNVCTPEFNFRNHYMHESLAIFFPYDFFGPY